LSSTKKTQEQKRKTMLIKMNMEFRRIITKTTSEGR
jgi:hypothetical protein